MLIFLDFMVRCRFLRSCTHLPWAQPLDSFYWQGYAEMGSSAQEYPHKLRDDLEPSALFSCQYSPDEWGNQLSDKKECYDKLAGIRCKLTAGFTVLISRAEVPYLPCHSLKLDF